MNETILIVDDDERVSRTFARNLTLAGYQVLTASGGEQALDIHKNEAPDITMVDVRMPGMDGFAVLHEIRQQDPDAEVIMVTGHGDMNMAIEALRAGASDFIPKPVEQETLDMALHRVQERLRLNRELQAAQSALRKAKDELEIRVEQRTRELRISEQHQRVLNTLLRISVEDISLEEQLQLALDEILAVSWLPLMPRGAIFLADRDVDMLKLWVHRDLETPLVDLCSKLPFNKCLCGQAAQERGIIFAAAIDERHKICYDGIVPHGHYCVPILSGERVTGVMTLYLEGNHQQHPQEIEFLQVVAHTLSGMIERKYVEEERERLLVKLGAQARRMQKLVDTVPEGVLLLDEDANIVLANPVAESCLSILGKPDPGKPLTYLGGQDIQTLLQSPPRGLWHEVEVNAPGPRTFEVIARLIQGEHDGWVMLIRDVTEAREVQRRVQQQERLATVGQLAAGIAHDFNNIMATIVLYAQMASRAEGLSDRDQERMAVIGQQAKHATNLIRQILDFSRRSNLERQPLDLLPLLKEQVKLLDRTLPDNIEISLDYDAAAFMVNADPTSIQQVVMNLAVNARDAMLDHGGELRIGLEYIVVLPGEALPFPELGKTEAREWVKLTVSDTGTGIASDVLPHIFDPFFTTKAPGKGTGLGLPQVFGIVSQHEGTVDVESQVQHGTTFTIYLPALLEQVSEPVAHSKASVVRGNGETVLVVEDNDFARRAFVEGLEMLNYRVLEASNGREAVRILEQDMAPSSGSLGGDTSSSVNLILCDLVMPEMGAMALLHEMRRRDWHIQVILISGHQLGNSWEELQTQLSLPAVSSEQGQKMALAGWLPKPASIEQISEAVASALR